jgi:hypothetical protein
MSGFAFKPQGYTEGAAREWLVANGLGGWRGLLQAVSSCLQGGRR